MIVASPPNPLATVLQKIPRAAVTEAFLVSSATWPDASKPIRIPAVARYDRHQFQPGGAPVPLYVVIKASWVVRKPQVWRVPMGSQMRLRTKSSMTTAAENQNTHLKKRGGMKFSSAARASRISVQIHWTARNLTLSVSLGKSTLKTVNS